MLPVPIPAPIEDVIAKARSLLDAVTFDSDGMMVGQVRVGGNGGLLSPQSIKAADALRLALDRLEQHQTVTA